MMSCHWNWCRRWAFITQTLSNPLILTLSYMPIVFLPPHAEQIWNIVIVAVVVLHTLLCVPVIVNVEQWLELSISGQVLWVSHCAMPMLEHYMQQLCDRTNHNYSHHLFRSKHALTSQITNIFRWSLWGLLGKLTECAQTFCLPFIRYGSFQSFTVGDLDSAMMAAFGPEIFIASPLYISATFPGMMALMLGALGFGKGSF